VEVEEEILKVLQQQLVVVEVEGDLVIQLQQLL
jgi:hypothetical protein